MDAFALNSATVNSVGSYASVVLLPSSTVTVDLALYERIAVSMEGTTGFSFDLVGNIARVSNLGNAPFVSSFVVAGDLTQYKTVSLGTAQTTISLALNGQITTVILGPSGVSSLGWDTIGSLLRIGGMVGETALVWTPAGAVTAVKPLGDQSMTTAFEAFGAVLRTQFLTGQVLSEFVNDSTLSIGYRNYLPDAVLDAGWVNTGNLTLIGGLNATSTSSWLNAGNLSQGYRQLLPASTAAYGFTVQGILTSTQQLSGEMNQSFGVSGSLTTIRYLAGMVSITSTLQGDLANNASGYDLKTLLMIRPESQREMTR